MDTCERTSANGGIWTISAVGVSLCLGVALSTSPLRVVAQEQGSTQTADSDRAAQDAQIESKVVIALDSSDELRGQQVAAATQDGDVLLTGAVNDAASKDLAQQVASRVPGVRSVRNNLMIGNAANSPGPDQAQSQDMNQTPQQTGDEVQASAPEPLDQQAQSPQVPMTEAPAPPVQNGQSQENAPYAYPSGPAPRPYPDQNSADNGRVDDPQDRGNYPQGSDPQDGQRRIYRMPDDDHDRQGGGDRSYRQDAGPVTIPATTMLRVRTSEFLDARRLQPGSTFEVTAANDVFVGGVLAVPRGAVLEGVVEDLRGSTSGSMTGASWLTLQLTSLNLEGHAYALVSDTWTGQGPGKGAYSANNTIGGAAVGAVIGGIIGRGPGAAVGAVAGGATGAAASSASNGPRMVVAPETVLTFHLTQPVTVDPVSYREAQRLASAGRASGRPYPRPRGYYPPPPPPYYYGRPYPYRGGWYAGYGW